MVRVNFLLFYRLNSTQLKDNPLIHTDFLDPANFCLQEYKKNLRHPFVIRKDFSATIETFSKIKNQLEKYDLIWALHSLYCAEKDGLHNKIWYFLNLLSNKDSVFLIYLASSKSSYYLIKDQYDKIINSPKSMDFLWSEDIENAFNKIPIKYNKKTIRFNHIVEKKDIRYYLNQCTFNNQSYLADWIFSNQLQKWLNLHYDGEKYIFSQEVVLFECKTEN